MFELAFNPYDMFIDYDSIRSKCTNLELTDLLNSILDNGNGFWLIDSQSDFIFNHSSEDYAIINDFDLYDINEYVKLFNRGDYKQYQTLFISSDNMAIEVAKNFGMSCIFIANNENEYQLPNLRNYPDHIVSITELKNMFLKNKRGRKLYFEGILDRTTDLSTPLYKQVLEYYYNPEKKVHVFMIGRYFRSEDLRSYCHILTKLILAFKDQKDGAYKLLEPMVQEIVRNLTRYDIDYITYIPNKPSKKDRFLDLFLNKNQLISSKIKPDLLECIRDYPTQKDYKTKKEKAANVKGAFVVNSNYDVQNKTIIIFDDILTTGSTALECASVLYDQGAENVILIPFGVTQDAGPSMLSIAKIKSNGIAYKLKFNNKNGNPFWVASDKEYKDHEVIKGLYLEQNNLDNLF
ncbi:ComF family protein [Lysinibacillus agricola]|uniref:ComF family protein n=1 Tax=Lysinibacillus agricola TaxID=2590012 RepID=A0ABX7AQC0_9BACI|nr:MULTISPECIES: ComF family protein [Lysinibacillus]KOS64647.1 hypothetical protein AN161_01080 [Lysinibacillus sp. FJAT-14222]QQP10444.1 ComF family protein [Lysinibacillus agricola]